MHKMEKSEKKFIIIVWLLLVLSFASLFFTTPDNQYRQFSVVHLPALLIFNIFVTVPKIRQSLNKQHSYLILAGYALLTFLFVIVNGAFDFQNADARSLAILILSLPVFYFLAISFINIKEKSENKLADSLRKELDTSQEKEKQLLEKLENLKKENETLKESTKEKTVFYDTQIIPAAASIGADMDRQGDLLWNLSMTLTSDLDLMTILSSLIEKIKDFTGYCSAAVFLYNQDLSELSMSVQAGLYENAMKLNLRQDIGIPNVVARTGKIMYIPDTTQDPRFKEISQIADFKSALYLPIKSDSRVTGVLCLWNKEPNSYSGERIHMLGMISQAAAKAIKNAELYRALDTRLNFIVTLWEATKSLTSSLDLSFSWEKVFEDRLKTTGYLFHADKVIFFQFRNETRELIPYITWNIKETTRKNFTIKLKQDPIILSEYMRAIFQVEDITVDSRYSSLLPHVQKENVKGMLWSPLMGRNRVIGALALFSTESRKWTKEETQWLEIFANFFSMTLENVRLLNDLFSEKNQLQKLVDNVPEGVFTTDTEGKIIIWNRAAEAITGYSTTETTGKWCRDIIKCKNREDNLCSRSCFVKKAMESKEKSDSGVEDVFLIHKATHPIPVFLASVPINDEDGNVVGTIVVFRDITEEKEIEQMKEEFLATITHDLKSPLASIMGYTELILNPKLGDLNSEQKEFSDAILRSSKTLQILINNILESTRMEAGKVTLHPILFRLHNLVKEIEEMFRPLFNHKMLKFEINMDPSTMVYGDRDKIKEVFINLVSNAVKFTPESGKITVSGEIRDEMVEVKVADTGKGIPEAAIPTLFKKFSQVKGQKRGTGLGLYICRKILEVHNHTIRVESKIGEGSVFVFTLSRSRSDTKRSGNQSILVIQNNETMTKEIKQQFEKNKYQVLTASNLNETKGFLDSEETLPGVVLLDWHLPNRESMFILNTIREDRKWQDLPIILICDQREELDGDYDALIHKPLDFRELLDKTDNFVRG
jgi:PAS domain S-box-containing protein